PCDGRRLPTQRGVERFVAGAEHQDTAGVRGDDALPGRLETHANHGLGREVVADGPELTTIGGEHHGAPGATEEQGVVDLLKDDHVGGDVGGDIDDGVEATPEAPNLPAGPADDDLLAIEDDGA